MKTNAVISQDIFARFLLKSSFLFLPQKSFFMNSWRILRRICMKPCQERKDSTNFHPGCVRFYLHRFAFVWQYEILFGLIYPGVICKINGVVPIPAKCSVYYVINLFNLPNGSSQTSLRFI